MGEKDRESTSRTDPNTNSVPACYRCWVTLANSEIRTNFHQLPATPPKTQNDFVSGKKVPKSPVTRIIAHFQPFHSSDVIRGRSDGYFVWVRVRDSSMVVKNTIM